MPTIVNAPLKSESGFQSPSFTVDVVGNITARSITLAITDDVGQIAADVSITEVIGNFRIDSGAVNNAGITLYRNATTTVDLALSTLTFNIFSSVGGTVTLYNNGLRHSDGTTGAASQGNIDGRLFVTLPPTTPDVLYYGNATGTIYGTITVLDPVGLFGTVSITGTNESTSSTTGALTVAGGVGIAEDLYVGGTLNIAGIGIPRLDSLTNLELNAANKIILQVDNIKIGELDSSGLSVTINNSTINNSTIGATTPSTAAFTTASVTSVSSANNSITNKTYVDTTAISLAIAFGL